jgi:hypothetical protein
VAHHQGQYSHYERPPVTATVHYGYWGTPFVFGDYDQSEPPQRSTFTRVVTLPRKGESQTELERDPVRASWPSH